MYSGERPDGECPGEGDYLFFFFQAEDGIRDSSVTGVQTCALPILARSPNAANVAMKTIQAIQVGSPILQLRYNRVVEMALEDPEADFSPAERENLAEF